MRNRNRAGFSLGLACSAALALFGCARGVTLQGTSGGADAYASADVQRLLAATRPFQTLDSAVAVGYPREVADCLVHAHHGAMGFHHVNRSYVDAKAEIERPEILLYEKLPDGKYRLNGVEFIVPFRFVPRDSTPPKIMGQTMAPEDNLKFWYVHVWAWNRNPDGIFANFHPGVACPSGNQKVFTPSGVTPSE